MEQDIVSLTSSGDVLFMMLGAVMVFTMHGGFAFLEVGTVRKKNQVNALVKILADFSISTIVYFLIGYAVAYGMYFFQPAKALVGENQGYELVHFFLFADFRCRCSSHYFWRDCRACKILDPSIGRRYFRGNRISPV